MSTRLLKIFLCHASVDKPAVRKLYRYLRDHKMDPWLDAEKLMPGQNWQVEIPNALLSSDVIIICLSKKSVAKEGYVQKEVKFALDKALEMPDGRIFLIPARLEECDLPNSLSAYQCVDLFEEDGYRRLLKSLRLRVGQIDSVEQVTDSVHEQNNLADEDKSETKDGAIDVGGDVSQESKNYPIWIIGLIAFAFLVLAVWGISSYFASPESMQTPSIISTIMSITPPISTSTPIQTICKTASVSRLQLMLANGAVTKTPDKRNVIIITREDIGALTNLLGQVEFTDPNVAANCVCDWQGKINDMGWQDINAASGRFSIKFPNPLTRLTLILYVAGMPSLTVQYLP